MKSLICLAAIGLLLLGAASASADDYPSRPIKFIVPNDAGTSTDSTARIIADYMSKKFGQPITIENMGAASGVIGAQYVAKSRPDGYTVLFGNTTTHAANVSLLKSMPYDPIKDFEPVALISSNTLVLIGNPSVPANNLKELIAYAKANPGKLSLATGSTSSRVAGEMLKKMADIDVNSVPYRSNAQAATDLLGNQVTLFFGDPATTLPLIKAGSAKGYAISRPSQLGTELPTMDKAGVPGYDFGPWIASYVPAHTPPEIIKKLNAAFAEATADKTTKERILKLGNEPETSSPEELKTFMASEIKRWAELTKIAGIEPQ